MSKQKQQQVGRLAFRVEGDNWACYYAMPNTMEGAILMGTVAIGVVRDPERKQMFMDLMKSALGDFLEERLGQRPKHWEEKPGPESERSGSA
jgi:hypothetical protein